MARAGAWCQRCPSPCYRPCGIPPFARSGAPAPVFAPDRV